MGQHRGIAFGLVVTICLIGFGFLAKWENIATSPLPLVKNVYEGPRVAGGWNYNITITYTSTISSPTVALGDQIFIDGYVTKFNYGTHTWVPAISDNNISIFIYGSSGQVDVSSQTTDSSGNFNLAYSVMPSLAIPGPYSIVVNVTGANNVGEVYNQPGPNYNPAIQQFNVYTDSQITPDTTPFNQWYLAGDTITVSGQLTSHKYPSIPIQGQTVFANAAPFGASAVTGNGGSFAITLELGSLTNQILFNFPGVPEYTGSSFAQTLKMLAPGDVALTSLKVPSQVFEGSAIIISGKLILSKDTTVPLADRQIVVVVQNSTAQAATDAQGYFNATLTLPSGTGAGKFDVATYLLYQNNGTQSPVGAIQAGALTVTSQFSPTNPENTGSYVLIGTIIGVVAAIIVIFLLIRKGFIKITRARPLYETNPVTLMGRVNALAATGRMAEAMAYLLYKYLDSLRFTMQMKKKPGQTVREVATEAVRRKLHKAEILYPWTSFVESAIYSGRRVSQSDLIKSKEYFEVANSVFPFAEHAPVPPAATGLPAEVPISVDQVPPEPSGEDNNVENE